MTLKEMVPILILGTAVVTLGIFRPGPIWTPSMRLKIPALPLKPPVTRTPATPLEAPVRSESEIRREFETLAASEVEKHSQNSRYEINESVIPNEWKYDVERSDSLVTPYTATIRIPLQTRHYRPTGVAGLRMPRIFTWVLHYGYSDGKWTFRSYDVEEE